MIANCVIDGKAFEISQADFDAINAGAGNGVPMIVCSDLCAAEFDINCLDWAQAKRDENNIRPY